MLAALYGVSAAPYSVSDAPYGVSAAPNSMSAAPHGVLALQDTHETSRGARGTLGWVTTHEKFLWSRIA